jgi:hypothetical protein
MIGMFAVILAVLLQSTSIKGTLEVPPGMAPPTAARVVLLPLEYAKLYNATAQERLDDFWEDFKAAGMARRNKELFIQYLPVIYGAALESVISEMRRDGIKTANLIKTAPQGQFEFNNVSPGEYKIIATASLRGVDYVWTETVQVTLSRLVVEMKTRVP